MDAVRKKIHTMKVLQFQTNFILIVPPGYCYPQAEMDNQARKINEFEAEAKRNIANCDKLDTELGGAGPRYNEVTS